MESKIRLFALWLGISLLGGFALYIVNSANKAVPSGSYNQVVFEKGGVIAKESDGIKGKNFEEMRHEDKFVLGHDKHITILLNSIGTNESEDGNVYRNFDFFRKIKLATSTFVDPELAARGVLVKVVDKENLHNAIDDFDKIEKDIVILKQNNVIARKGASEQTVRKNTTYTGYPIEISSNFDKQAQKAVGEFIKDSNINKQTSETATRQTNRSISEVELAIAKALAHTTVAISSKYTAQDYSQIAIAVKCRDVYTASGFCSSDVRGKELISWGNDSGEATLKTGVVFKF